MANKAQRSILILKPVDNIEGMEEFRQKHIQSEGKEVPFHITLLPNFYLPTQMDNEIESKLSMIAKQHSKFSFQAVPISSFPTSKVIYLSPVPVGPIEKLVDKVKKELPKYDEESLRQEIYHMTIAMGNPIDQTNEIIREYFNQFGREPLDLQAGELAIYIKSSGKWIEYQSFELQ